MTLVEWDYAGVELRLASYYAYKVGHDRSMFELFEADADVHAATAHVLGAYEQIPDAKNARMVGKVTNLALLYGAGAGRLQAQLYKDYGFQCTLDQATEWHRSYHEAYPGLRSAANRYSNYHRKKGNIELWNGRRCRIRVKGPGLEIPHHDAFNRLIQGGCGVILMQALIRLTARINAGEIDAKMCNTVHDSVWAYVPNDRLTEVTKQIIDVMEGPATKRFEIPFTVEPTCMTRTDIRWEDGQWRKVSESTN
jgi:DNA polymerase I-like protein with 3'-5' exonuclease and polymerase domains